MSQRTKRKTRRKVAVLVDAHADKLYAAVAVLAKSTKKIWLSLDEVAVFVREQQDLFARTGGSAGGEFALIPPDLYRSGWDDYTLAHTFRHLVLRGLLDSRDNLGSNEVRAVDPAEHGIHQLRDPSGVEQLIQIHGERA